MQSLIRFIAFLITFGVGAGALTLSVLCDDLARFLTNKQVLTQEQDKLAALKNKVEVYDALLKNLKQDPDLVQRIAPAVLGIEIEDPNTAYPLTGVYELAVAKEVLKDNENIASLAMPAWFVRSCEERRRTALFLAGGVLVLIAFACFGLVKPEQVEEEE